ncbi:hypothetical protein TWF694_004529 [Orbilia ellipsospora]|uniref:VWFA domain-containing protein n=1 Tax=Orbilia ellipsospora TaxID=2528407 RepID=A0AAV9WWX9_9PEZI
MSSLLDRPLPATPVSERRPSNSLPASKPYHVSKPRNRLKKRPVVDGSNVTNPQSSSDGELTPRPLAIRQPASPVAASPRPSIDLNLRENLQSRWSTSTSDVASGIFPRRESKRKIFGIPISFKRRVKSEIPSSLQSGSGFFGSRFGSSKLSLALGSPKTNNNGDQQWRSSRASSSMTVRGVDGTISDDEVSPRRHFPTSYEEYSTPRGTFPLRRHTLTGNLLGLSPSPQKLQVSPSSLSRSSSIYSSNRSSNGDTRASLKNFLSLFPQPPKRDTLNSMHMTHSSSTMPLIVETPEHMIRSRGFNSPSHYDIRSSIISPSYQRKVPDLAIRPINALNKSQVFLPGIRSRDEYSNQLTSLAPRISITAPLSTPRGFIHNPPHKKPILTHLDLQVTAAIDLIETGETRDVWAVIELNGSLANNIEMLNCLVSSLDVIFLLDLSQNMSDQSVTTMKATTSYLLENLTGTLSDSFGMAAFTSTSACEVLMPMIPCTHQAKHRAFTLLSKVATASDPFLVETPISNVIRAACSMFMPGPYGRNKNLIILTSAVPTHQNNMVDVSGFEDVKVHVIGVGNIYSPVSEAIYADSRDGGSSFCFPADMMDVKTSPEDENHKLKLQVITRRFTRAMRYDRNIGIMRDVRISITPGDNVTIKSIVGNTHLMSLRPGERVTVLVRMSVTCVYQNRSAGSDDGLDALEERLYATLGMESMKLLSVNVGYKHSLLPDTATLTATTSAKATIVERDSPWNITGTNLYDTDGESIALRKHTPTPRQNFVRKALLHKICMEEKNPKDALVGVESIVNGTEEKDLEYFNVVRELKYQIKVWNSRRRGRVIGGGEYGERVSFYGRDEESVKRPFSFDVNGNTNRARNEMALSTPTPMNGGYAESSPRSPSNRGHDINCVDEGDDSGSVRRYSGIDTPSPEQDESFVTVIASEERRVSEWRPADSASRLWKRIEMAGEVGSIGESSIGSFDTALEGVDGNDAGGGETTATETEGSLTGGGDGDGGGETKGKRRKGGKKKNKKVRRRRCIVPAGSVELGEGEDA